MSDKHWNDDVADAFSIHRMLMWIIGLWPQQQNIFTIIQWSLSIILQLTSFSFLFVEFNENHHDTSASIEAILFLTCTMACILKSSCIFANRKKLAKNIDNAINDWSIARNDKATYRIMKKYVFKSKLFTAVMVYLSCTGSCLYLVAVAFTNLKQIFLRDPNATDANTIDWMFLFPSGNLGHGLDNSLYVALILLQSLQLFVICISQNISDCFYIGITLHLTGQLKILKTRFKTFANKPDTNANYRKQLVSLIDRHCELAELHQNIEDTFHLIILFQLVIVTILLALLGLRIISCLRNNDYVLLAKSILAIIFMFMESLVYTYGSDFLQKESEGIFHAMFAASWFTLPATLMKDVHFAMMRASYPFRLTGGKFFYANSETMVYVLKTAASYVSVLRIALRETSSID